VGDIADEHEIVQEFIKEQPDGSYVLDARIPLDEVNEELGLTIVDEQFNTLGGHVFGVLGREPRVGDAVSNRRYSLAVAEADRHRIMKLRLVLKEPEPVENAAESTEEAEETGPYEVHLSAASEQSTNGRRRTEGQGQHSVEPSL